MAKEFKHKGGKDFKGKSFDGKGKKSFASKRGKPANEDKKSSFRSSSEKAHPFAEFKRPARVVEKERDSFSYDRKKSSDRTGDDTRSSENLKYTKTKDTKNDTPFSEKRSRPDKRDNKPSFDRYKDESRPSDFGSFKKPLSKTFKRTASDKTKSFDNKVPRSSDVKTSFKSRGDEKPKSFGKKVVSEKPAFKRKSDEGGFNENYFADKSTTQKRGSAINPNDLDERDFNASESKPSFASGRSFKRKPLTKKTTTKGKGSSKPQRAEDDGLVRLNKYISNAGICSRREADDLIATGVVQVNGKVITEMGYRVKPTDIIKYGGQTLKKERLVYLILNKPKDYITTVDDPQERKTVLELVGDACRERIYPVGRLDRATTGLLMFTNDGDLTKKLTHPRYGVRKIYHAELDKPLKRSDLDRITEGVELEDGLIKVDEISYVGDGADKTQVGVEIHSGKNRIVRRLFEHMGYNVRKLDRVVFGPLTKKDLPRGRYRLLTDAEVGMLKMISAE